MSDLPAPPSVRTTSSVLVVEDDDDERELLAMLLERHGLHVKMAASVHEALKALQRCAFKIILADYDLPDGTGTEMLREAKRLGLLRGAKALLCTAQMYPKRDPGVGLIRKPLDLNRVISEARSA